MAFMLVSILSRPSSDPLEDRLGQIQVACRRFQASSIQSLSHDSDDVIYLIPFEMLAQPEWPQLRVRLAQANRYYLVGGEGLNSSNITTAVKDGAHDVLLLADPDDRWRDAIRKVADSQKLWLQLYGGTALPTAEMLLGQSAAMKSLRQAIERLGPTAATVLILGESGTGKERVASGLHTASGRGAFVAVNCAAIPKELMEAELFGAEKGAYTGAVKTRAGLVEQAAGGTLFLDEIGEMDIKLQPKLLRFLETRKARRVGGNTEIQAEVRVISATNSNLEGEIAAGRFRSDLYYRLSEVILHVPPLRTRPEDVPQFAMAFMQAACERLGKYFDSIEPDLVRKLQGYSWPGNVRELRNAIDRMIILYDGPVLRAAWWEVPQTRNAPSAEIQPGTPGINPGSFPGAPGMPINRKQKLQLARQLLDSSGNDLTWVAAQLGIHPTTLYRWRKSNKV